MAQQFFQGLVKNVLSGDTLIVTSTNNPALERTFSLAFVTGPHMKKDAEEPFAFHSRDHLRNLAVGKEIRCTVLYKVPTTEREYGYAQTKDGYSLPDDMVAAGWLKVREDAGRKEESEDAVQRLERLRALESQAKSEGKGLWSGTGGIIEVQNELESQFMTEWKGKTVDTIVERVLSGDRFLTRLLLSDKKHCQVITLLAGIRTPSTERVIKSTGQSQPAEEFGNEAKLFVERRLLQRQVQVFIAGASPQGQLIGSLIHPKGNIAEFLLLEGLARCNDFHSTMLGDKMAALRAAEKDAQAKRLRVHRNHVAKATADETGDLIVSKIIGADTIIVRNKAGTIEKRVNLSSVRGPRTGEPSEAPFRDEAKEFLRKKLIGKHVRLSVDGKKPATDEFEARDVATVTEKGKNVGLMLVQEGYCSVLRHRKDDTDRAPNYDELLAAQETAREDKKGMWSGKAPKVKQYLDISESMQKAKIQLSSLQRQKKVPAIVDFCKAGSRFTILIPREGVKLTMVLGGVRSPRAPRLPQDKGEPFGQEAMDLAIRRCNQRDCEVSIYDMDKVGGFIGDLYINRENFAKILVEEGFASVHAYSAEKSGNAAELFAAERAAKEGRKGVWHDYDPATDTAGKEPAAPVESVEEDVPGEKRPTDYRDVIITSVDENGRLKLQQMGKGTASLELLMSEFRKFHLDPRNRDAVKDAPKVGDFVSAKFSEDGQWYRARIRSNDRAGKAAEVVYIDYGNMERKPWADLRPLDASQFGPGRLKAQATDASLSFVQLPVARDYFNDARNFIAELTDGKELVGCFDYVDAKEGLSYVTLYETKDNKIPEAVESINRDVVAAGHGMVPRKLKAWERAKAFEPILKSLQKTETAAKEGRKGMWEYGDITED